MTIYWDFVEKSPETIYHNENGFASKANAKETIKNHFKNMSCNKCSSKKLEGSGVNVDITKVTVKTQETVKGMFWGEKIKEKTEKIIFRVGEPYLKNGGLLGGTGYIKCTNCGNKAKGSNMFWGQWARNIADGYRRGDFN